MKVIQVYPEDVIVVMEMRLSEVKKLVTAIDSATFNDVKCKEENDFVIDIFLEKLHSVIKEFGHAN